MGFQSGVKGKRGFLICASWRPDLIFLYVTSSRYVTDISIFKPLLKALSDNRGEN